MKQIITIIRLCDIYSTLSSFHEYRIWKLFKNIWIHKKVFSLDFSLFSILSLVLACICSLKMSLFGFYLFFCCSNIICIRYLDSLLKRFRISAAFTRRTQLPCDRKKRANHTVHGKRGTYQCDWSTPDRTTPSFFLVIRRQSRTIGIEENEYAHLDEA